MVRWRTGRSLRWWPRTRSARTILWDKNLWLVSVDVWWWFFNRNWSQGFSSKCDLSALSSSPWSKETKNYSLKRRFSYHYSWIRCSCYRKYFRMAINQKQVTDKDRWWQDESWGQQCSATAASILECIYHLTPPSKTTSYVLGFPWTDFDCNLSQVMVFWLWGQGLV